MTIAAFTACRTFIADNTYKSVCALCRRSIYAHANYTEEQTRAAEPWRDRMKNGHNMDILNERQQVYGDPARNLDVAARLVSIVLGHPVTPHDVCVFMACMKLARIITGKVHEDNYIDLAGYAELARQMAVKEAE